MARQAVQDELPAAGPSLLAVPDLLRRIRDTGRRIAVASSAKRDELDKYLDIAGIRDLVDVMISSGGRRRVKTGSRCVRSHSEEVGN